MNDSTCSRCSKHLYRDDFGFLCPDCASADAARDAAKARSIRSVPLSEAFGPARTIGRSAIGLSLFEPAETVPDFD